MKIAIYTRVSSTMQVQEGFSLEAQYERLVNFVKLNQWDLVRVYTDPGVSAKDLNRPGVTEMIADLKKGKFEALLVHKLDRLTRNISDLYDLVELVNDKNIKLISLSENIDTSTPMGRMFVYLLGIFAQMFRENLREEVIKGMTQRAENGLRNGGAAPFGYIFEDDVMVIEDDKADIIRNIFGWYLNKDMGTFHIANKLNREGIVGNRNGTWHQSTILQILRNHTYAGKYHWKTKDQDEIIIRDGEHQAIIEDEVFDAVQEKLKRRGNYERSRSVRDYPFTTILKCAQCGRAYHGYKRPYKGTVFQNYRCTGRMKYGAICKNKDISESKLAKLFFQYLHKMKEDITFQEQPIQNTDKERKNLEKELQKSEARRKNWQYAFGDGNMPYDDYVKLIDEEMLKVAELQQQLEQLPVSAPPVKITRDVVMKALEDLEKNWDYLELSDRKNIVQTLVRKIVINHTKEICEIQLIEFY